MAAAFKVIMVRHGESVYNQENRFCGWYDADLATTGVDEAKKAGKVKDAERNAALSLNILGLLGFLHHTA